jgi:hypothetical protein
MKTKPLDEFLEKIDSPIQQELIEERYKFAHPYTDHEGNTQIASVVLHVDFESQTFKVYPGDGRGEFGFIAGSHRFNMWIATTKCLTAAIEFAVETLTLVPDESSLTS